MSENEFSDAELEKIKRVKVGKWDIISEYHRIDWEEKGHDEEESKIHGTLIAILGYQKRTGHSPQIYEVEEHNGEKGKTVKQRGEEKWITSKEFDKIIKKIGNEFYRKIFSPAIKNLYDKGYSYDEVKKAVNIPSKIGAKVTLDNFIPFLNT
ncbi:MAG: hypothetical protein EAX91_10605 [Candidatus Lokiarchaeota archaeon]|nr:hypothetical protein [Candidatus Lokiarchaeota archaeon]